MKSKLVILRGKPTSGKSTAYAALRKRKDMKKFIFVDHCKLKKKLGKESGKKVLFDTIKSVMPTKKDIIIEEMSREAIMKYLRKDIKKYNYKIIVFQFEVSRETAYKRDVKRSKEKKHPFMGKKWINETHKMHEDRFDKKGILVDTNKLNKKQVVRLIINKLNP